MPTKMHQVPTKSSQGAWRTCACDRCIDKGVGISWCTLGPSHRARGGACMQERRHMLTGASTMKEAFCGAHASCLLEWLFFTASMPSRWYKRVPMCMLSLAARTSITVPKSISMLERRPMVATTPRDTEQWPLQYTGKEIAIRSGLFLEQAHTF